MRVVTRLGAGLALTVFLVAADVARAAFLGDNGKLAQQVCPFRCGITTLDQAGEDALTVGGVFGPIGAQLIRNDHFPRWSADGEWIAFQRNVRPADSPFSVNTITVMRDDGSDMRPVYELPAGASVTSMSWAPGGDRIAFTQIGAAGIWIVDAAGPPDPRVIFPTSQAAYDANPSAYIRASEVEWSPDGGHIAFSYVKGETTKGIGLLPPDADGAEDLVALTTLAYAKPGGGCCNRSEHGEPTWSPDGTRIAFAHGELDATINEGTRRIETIDPDGTDLDVVIDFPQGEQGGAAYVTQPRWSPDGEWIVWRLTRGTTAKWEGAHPDGSGRGDLPATGVDLAWQPCSSGCQSVFPGFEPPPPPTVSVADVTVTEGDAGTTTATFTVTRSGAAWGMSKPSSVGFSVGQGSATLGQDVVGASGTVNFAADQVSKQFTVSVVGDAVDEADETFTVTLFAHDNVTIDDGQATGTIADDDPTPTLSVGDVTVAEGGFATVTVTLSEASGRVVTAGYGTAAATTTAGSDFHHAAGTLTFGIGTTTKTVAVSTIADSADEPDETLTFELSSPSGATLADGTGQITITDDDSAPVSDPPVLDPPVLDPPIVNPPVVAPPAVAPPAGGPAPFSAADAIRLPPRDRCVGRSLKLRVREPAGVDVTRIVVTVGKRKLTRRNDDAVGSTTLRRLPAGRFTVKVRVFAADGRTVELSRRFRSCR